MKEALSSYIQEQDLFNPATDRLLLAVSGGVDSMVLLDLLNQMGVKIAVAHCNFQLRGEDSDADQQLVERTCLQKGLTLHKNTFDTNSYATENKVSIQMAARELRYDWFNSLVDEYKYHYIVTAHHLNDSVETVLLNLTKGTGINGLTGIAPKSGRIIRPLLFASKEHILAYAKTHSTAYREDASNASSEYERNFIRLHVIPALKSINPSLEATFHRSMSNFQFAQHEVSKVVRKNRRKYLHDVGPYDAIYIQQLMGHPYPTELLYTLIKDLGFNRDQTQEIVENVPTQSGKEFLSKTHRIVIDRNQLLLLAKSERRAIYEQITLSQTETDIADRKITFEQVDTLPDFSQVGMETAYLCLNKLEFPLVIRSWVPGDYFYPLGLGKKKKLSRFFIDQKVSIPDKERALVLVSGDCIAWVMGYRIDERFKARTSSPSLKVQVT